MESRLPGEEHQVESWQEEPMKPALEGRHDVVEKEEQPKELSTTNERSTSGLNEVGAYGPEVESELLDD